MSELAIETQALTKSYRRGNVVAVSNLSLRVPRGGVHGFLGPNGSGKTTTLRMLLGLIHADSGTMAVLGRETPAKLEEVISQIGAIVESPKFFPSASARNNLEILATAIDVPKAKVDQVLRQVGLSGRAKTPYSTFSLGMKQRLAIAATMLKDPEIYIFDEPTNGLDPSGIHEIRETMRSLGAAGKTVLVSSHILHEVEQIADTVTIIGRGRLLAEGSVGEILGTSAAQVKLRTTDDLLAGSLLAEAGYQVNPQPEHLAILGDEGTLGAAITKLLASRGVWVIELTPAKRSLEQTFLELTSEEHLTRTQSSGGTASRKERR